MVDKDTCVAFNIQAYVSVDPLQGAPKFEYCPSRKHSTGPPNSNDVFNSPPGNRAERWRRDGHNEKEGQ